MENLVIDGELRLVSPPNFVAGVANDRDVRRVHFTCPRFYDDNDLSQFEIGINSENAKGDKDRYVCDDVSASDSEMTFSWLIGRVPLAYAGKMRFIVCMRTNDKEYNTTVCEMDVLQGIKAETLNTALELDIVEQLRNELA